MYVAAVLLAMMCPVPGILLMLHVYMTSAWCHCTRLSSRLVHFLQVNIQYTRYTLAMQVAGLVLWVFHYDTVYTNKQLINSTLVTTQVQIRPWRLSDSDYIMDHTQPIDARKTIFIGGVPRPLKASELADIFNSRYGNVCYAGIDCDPDLKYPKGVCAESPLSISLINHLLTWQCNDIMVVLVCTGAGRVTFSSRVSFMSAVSCRFLQVTYGDIDKKVCECTCTCVGLN